MKEIRITLEQFDAKAFLDRIVEFLRISMSSEAHPTYGIFALHNLGDVPVYGPESGWDVLSAFGEGKLVFLPFAFMDAHGTLACADGNIYETVSDTEGPEIEMLIGLEDCIGFLVQVINGVAIINSAIHSGGACPGPLPSVDLCSGCRSLDEPMANFIQGFILTKIKRSERVSEKHLLLGGWRPLSREMAREFRNGDFSIPKADEIFLVDNRVAAILDSKQPGTDLSHALKRAVKSALIYGRKSGNARPLAFVEDGGEYYCNNLAANSVPLKLGTFPTPTQLHEFLRPNVEEFRGSLRPYQENAVSQVVLCILSGRRRMYLQMAGGAGKTITAAAIIAKLYSTGLIGKTLFLVDREALANQTVTKFINHLGERFTVGRAQGGDEDKDKAILVSTIQHLATGNKYSGYDPGHFGLVIVDECHRSYFGAWLPVLDHFFEGGAIIIGLTATPSDSETVNTDAFFTDPGQYFGPIFRYTEDQAVGDHDVSEWERLAECEYYAVSTDADLDSVEEIGFDFEPEQLGRAVDVLQRNQLIAQTYFDSVLKDGEIVKTIVFAASIAHAKNLTRALITQYNRRNDLPEDHPAAERFIVCVHHEMPNASAIIEEFQKITNAAERRAIIDQAMKDPEMRQRPLVLVGVGMLDTGIDVPDLQALLMARPTMSRILYAQMKGRGTRKCKETGKASYKLVDFDRPAQEQAGCYLPDSEDGRRKGSGKGFEASSYGSIPKGRTGVTYLRAGFGGINRTDDPGSLGFIEPPIGHPTAGACG